MHHRIPLFVTLAVLSSFPLPGGADEEEDYLRARTLRQRGEIRPLEEVVNRALLERPGHLLETELEEKRGRLIYEIEILDRDGRVWEFKFDARSGESLGSHQEE